jgi:predicted membrane-bound spermidine synthase
MPQSAIWLYCFYFLSGACALVYQNAWQRILGLFAGSDAVASSIVVGGFLFGLGAGSLVASRIADRLSRRGAIFVFALCEFGIAAFALVSHSVFYDLLFVRLGAAAQSTIAVFVLSFLVLLPPTLLMGMSLPLVTRAIVTDVGAASRQIGWLYGLNTMGAAIGTLFAGFTLIGSVGYQGTTTLAAAMNVLIGIAALIVVRRSDRPTPAPAAPAHAGAAVDHSVVRHWCMLAFGSGFLIVGLEIVWFRVLSVLMQSNAYAFSVVLTVFLAADALGLAFASLVIVRIRDVTRWFHWTQAGTALYALGSLWLLSLGHEWWQLSSVFVDAEALGGRAGADVAGRFLTYFALTTVVVGPPAFLAGLSMPVVQRAIQDDAVRIGRRVGLIQLANILGNAAGALITGLALLHYVGTTGTLRIVGIAGAVFAATLIRDRQRRRRWVEAAAAAVLLILAVAYPSNAHWWAAIHGGEVGRAIVEEDRTGVAVLKPSSAGTFALYTGGHSQSHLPFANIHGSLGVLGPVVHPAPASVLVIGNGTGGTPYAMGLNSATTSIRVVEIVGSVFPVMQRFASGPDGHRFAPLFADPRITHVVGDARHVLYTDARQYDIIQADAILPWTAHSGLLYSVEFFQQVRARLRPGGICVQWIPTPRTLATFRRAFPYVVQIRLGAIGSDQPLTIPPDIETRLDGERKSYLAVAGWRSAVLSHYIAGTPEFWDPASSGDGRDVNLDLFPRDEYFLNQRQLSLPDPPRAIDGATVVARPNPVPPGTGAGATQISWDTGTGGAGRVLAIVDARRPTVIAEGERGTATVDAIADGSTYEFRVVKADRPDVVLASTTVTRTHDTAALAIILQRVLIGLAAASLAVWLAGRWFGRVRVHPMT